MYFNNGGQSKVERIFRYIYMCPFLRCHLELYSESGRMPGRGVELSPIWGSNAYSAENALNELK